MSKFIPDPQIQSLKAMRAGDIAFANGGNPVVGVAPLAFAQPIVNIPVTPPAPPPTLEAVVSPAGETPAGPTVAPTTRTSDDAAISVLMGGVTDALEALAGTPNETPTVGVAFGTSVV